MEGDGDGDSPSCSLISLYRFQIAAHEWYRSSELTTKFANSNPLLKVGEEEPIINLTILKLGNGDASMVRIELLGFHLLGKSISSTSLAFIIMMRIKCQLFKLTTPWSPEKFRGNESRTRRQVNDFLLV